MLTCIHFPQTDLSEGFPKATCEFPQRLLTAPPIASGLTARAARSRLPLLQGERDQLTILRIVQWALKGVES